jgi:hypothetical protein
MPPKSQEPFEPSLTVPEFCSHERISEPTYYELKKLGLNPAELRYPNGMVRITHRARLAWQDMLANPPPEVAERMRGIIARRQTQARAAAAKAIASPNHVSNRRRGVHMGQPAAPPPKRKLGRGAGHA